MDIPTTIFSLIILLFSVIIHELSHGYVAQALGDPTAKYAGRLTLNPVSHLDLFGSVLLPILLLVLTAGQGPIFGWAKPVPINPYNFRDQRWGSFKVAIAGPISNFTLALFFGLLLRLASQSLIAANGGMLIIFVFIVQINIILAIFNLIPIPPLDGHWIFFQFIPNSLAPLKMFLQQYGMFILIFLIFSGGLGWMYVIVQYLFRVITGYS